MNASPMSAALEYYVRTPDFESHVDALELSPALWDIFALTEGRISAADIANELGLQAEVALSGLQELAKHRLVRRHVQRWQDYRGGKRQPPPPPAVVAAPPVVVVPPAPVAPVRVVGAVPTDPKPVVAAPIAKPLPAIVPKRPMAPAESEIRFRIAPPAGRRPRNGDPTDLIRIVLRRSSAVLTPSVPVAVETAAPREKAWPLRPIIDAILRHGGGGVSGQLLAYRVFLRVPADLLDRAGLHSLNLVADDFLIRDPELYEALCRSLREVAGLDVSEIRGSGQNTLLCA